MTRSETIDMQYASISFNVQEGLVIEHENGEITLDTTRDALLRAIGAVDVLPQPFQSLIEPTAHKPERARATSASDRYERARAALASYDAIEGYGDSAHHERVVAAIDALDALRMLTEVPDVVSPSDEDAQRIYDAAFTAVMPAGMIWHGVPFENAHAAARRALVNAGIQAAWESWEPENAPGMVDTRPTYTIASLDGTVDEASWLVTGHVLDSQETEWLRHLEVVRER